MPRIAELGHSGLWVNDLETMKDFYTRVLGLTVTDEDDRRGMVFFSSRPDEEHHEFVIMRGRNAPRDARLVQQISWHVGSVDDLLEFHRLLQAEGVQVEREVTHGIALAIYFFDPEGNRIEVYWQTDQRVPQPFGKAIDLDQPAEAVLAQAQSLLPGATTASA